MYLHNYKAYILYNFSFLKIYAYKQNCATCVQIYFYMLYTC